MRRRVFCISHFRFHRVAALVIVGVEDIMIEFGIFKKISLAIEAVFLKSISNAYEQVLNFLHKKELNPK